MKTKNNNEIEFRIVTLTSMLAVVFTTLKLTGHIDWSWWLVLSPLLIDLAIVKYVGSRVAACYDKNER